MKNSSPNIPESVQPVSVRRHRVDWECADLAEVTAQRAMSLGSKLANGCWFLNPRFTVSSPAPTAEFFRTVLSLRSSWLRTCRQVLGNYGQRRLSRQAERQGRQGAILAINPDAAEKDRSHRPPQSVPLSDLPDDQRREVIEAGQIAKGLGFAGVLFIEGDSIPPRTWQARADELLNAEPNVLVNTTRRRVDLAAFKSTGDPEPLRTISRLALQEHLERQPSHAAYVSPQVTVSAPSATPAFYAEAKRRQAQWCILLNRTLGCGNLRRARRASDTATISLAYSGTLVVDGQIYLPQCWPTHSPKPSLLRKTPCQSPTVPPTFLGLDSRLREDSGMHPQTVRAISPELCRANTRDLNELFVTLFTSGRPWTS